MSNDFVAIFNRDETPFSYEQIWNYFRNEPYLGTQDCGDGVIVYTLVRSQVKIKLLDSEYAIRDIVFKGKLFKGALIIL